MLRLESQIKQWVILSISYFLKNLSFVTVDQNINETSGTNSCERLWEKNLPVPRYIPASKIDNDVFLLLWWLRYQRNIAHNKFLSLSDKAVNGNVVNV